VNDQNQKKIILASTETLQELLGRTVDIIGIADETDSNKLDELVFALCKETLRVLIDSSQMLDEASAAKGGVPRNQAICTGLIVRILKFMTVVVQLSSQGNRREVVYALNRSVVGSATNLEFLVCADDDKYFDQFVKCSLSPEREFYDKIQDAVAERKGKILPVEQSILDSIDEVCSASGVKIEDVDRKHINWGGDPPTAS
jgi:hypothetical protein